MSGKAARWDNAVAGRFLHSRKVERFHLPPFKTRVEAEKSILRDTLRPFTIASATIPLTFNPPPFTQKYFSRVGKRLRAGVHKTAQAQYLVPWEAFKQKLEVIPSSHLSSFSLWPDHFDNLPLWAMLNWMSPCMNHSKTTTSLAVVLWRYHADLNHNPETVKQQLRAQWDRKREDYPESAQAWNEKKFLPFQSDFFGIQNSIFAKVETEKLRFLQHHHLSLGNVSPVALSSY